MRRLTLALAILALVLVASAEAQAKRRAYDAQFTALDTNEDRRLSEGEFVGQRTGEAKEKSKRQFRELDQNSDRELSVKEYKRVYSL